MKAWPNDEQRSDQGQHQASSYLIEVRDSTTTTWKTKKNMVANEWKNWVRLFCFLPNMANSLIFIKNSLFISYFCCSGHYYKTVGRLATIDRFPPSSPRWRRNERKGETDLLFPTSFDIRFQPRNSPPHQQPTFNTTISPRISFLYIQ